MLIYFLTFVHIIFPLSLLFPSATLFFLLLCLIIIKWTYHRVLLFLKSVNVENKVFVGCQTQAAFCHLQNTGLVFIWSHGNWVSSVAQRNVLAGSSCVECPDEFYGLRTRIKHDLVTVCIVRPLSAIICISSRDPLNYSGLCLQQFGRLAGVVGIFFFQSCSSLAYKVCAGHSIPQ